MNYEGIRDELGELSMYDVLVFGSLVTGEHRPGSDIDIAVLAHTEEENKMIALKKSLLSKIPEGYDLNIFESLPTLIKGGVLENYEVLFGDPPSIGEYLRKFRKEWEDFKHRIEFPTIKEMRKNQ